MATVRNVGVEIEVADASLRRTDVLVLKYAQAPHGLDRFVLDLMGSGRPRNLPPPGEHIVVHNPSGIEAAAVAFLGVPTVGTLGYREIREFGVRAVEVVGAELPGARELCLTLHGVNSGLDEREAFRAQLGGILTAVTALRADAALRRIVFLERAGRRAARMKETFEELEGGGGAPPPGAPPASSFRPEVVERLRMAGLDSAARPHAFVAMPFDEAFDDVFYYGITGPVERAGLLCERMDRSVFTGDIVETMKRRIRTADVVVADLSGGNPNVYLEVGFAWAAGVPTVLLCDGESDPHFDVRGHRYLRYRSIREAERHLARELAMLLPQVDRAR
jgi:hypothetical protein